MTRPEIIRADSIDLQDRDAPSAKGHHKPAADGSLAPHQAETLREVAAETAEERLRSPRVSWVNGDVGDLQQYAEDLAAGVAQSLNSQQSGPRNANDIYTHDTMHAGPQQDALAIAQNGGLSAHDADDGDLDDTEVDMDDDMMDKISSSPSIEDGGSTLFLPPLRSKKLDALGRASSPSSRPASPPVSDVRSSSPYLQHPDHLPLYLKEQQADLARPVSPIRHHHLYGEFQAQDVANGSRLSSSYDSVTSVNGDDESEFHINEPKPSLSEGTTTKTGTYDVGRPASPMTDMSESNSYQPSPGDQGFSRLEILGASAHDDRNSDDLDVIDDFDDSGLTVPYDSDGDDDDDFSSLDDARCLDSGWGGECLQDTEDIDFEFVYALHTFVATVEGQANATKGDTMVLLDDSNSYWWLVRVVKDSSIGYLPAEHIETPTERLARLNKHRNIDLSATMLGDQAEKSRNPLKSAIKRRKTKTVQFAGEQIDYYDLDYSTDEEDLETAYFAEQQQQAQQVQEVSQRAAAEAEAEDETAKVEPLRPRSQQKETKADSKKREAGETDPLTGASLSRDSEEIFETKADGPKKTSDGIVRDSFFKDDTVETKKITLTPNLLRDDNAPRSSNDSRELKQRPSLDKLEKDSVVGKEDKKKKDKKEKEKKPSSIRSFFSRKDKKVKGDEDDDSFGKRSMDAEVQEKEMEEEVQTSPDKASGPQRNPSKLQKQQPRTEPSPTRKPGGSNTGKESGLDVAAFLSEGKLNSVANVPPASMRIVESDSPGGSPRERNGSRERSPHSNTAASRTPNGEVRPPKATKAKMRVELDDFDSDEDYSPEPTQEAPVARTQAGQQRSTQGSYSDSYQLGPQAAAAAATQTAKPTVSAVTTTPPQQHVERLSESPVQVSPVNVANPPALMVDTSSQEEDRSSLRSTPSPELIEHGGDGDMRGNKDSMTTSTSTSTMSWNDVNLRAFFDSGSEIRDMLVVVYDKSDVAPAGPEHPVAGTLFKEPKAALAEITTQLDNMLGDWLARKQRSRGTL
ncbi:hypothetical protein B0H66DRAFT_474035 [Apodospora peruviana]|uniref:SH3 domain-containing protein n=1 Tax=Apodospora peruviana TaxID=516989 RepID=A0AAE0ID99_9PEZI|nr:hypothetical protein B0H66DRAFT_474035 [Apodospora peruviana]